MKNVSHLYLRLGFQPTDASRRKYLSKVKCMQNITYRKHLMNKQFGTVWLPVLLYLSIQFAVKEGADVAASASSRRTSKAVIAAAQPHHTAWQYLNNWAVQAGVSGLVW